MNESDIADSLTGLIEICANGEQVFLQCAAGADDMALQLALTRRAATWRRWTTEAQALCNIGPLARTLARDVTMQPSLNDASLLALCERFDESALQRYRQVLELDLPRITRAIVQRHADGIRAGRVALRSLHTTMQQHAA